MEYRITLKSGEILTVTKVGGCYVSQEEIREGMFGKNTTIESAEGTLTIKRPKIEGLTKQGNVWKFILRELTKEERQEATRLKRQNRQNEWIREKYERVSMTLPLGTKERIMNLGYSVNGFINEAVKVMLEASEGRK